MEIFGDAITLGTGFFLFLAVGLALSFEFVNGFHDTANAVATVIYTHSLKANYAVIWSGCWNLIGVLVSTGAVAFSVTALLPVELVLNVGSAAGFAMVFALLISAMIWNLGTWSLGLPASSSHTLIGSILGVGLANSLMTKGQSFGEGVNWAKASEVGISLLVSPLVGFCLAAMLLLLSKALLRRPELYRAPAADKAPPLWIRCILILTCTGVSFAHGSNDGQKGMGLIMLILVGVLPGVYALNLRTQPAELAAMVQESKQVVEALRQNQGRVTERAAARKELSRFLKTSSKPGPETYPALAALTERAGTALEGKTNLVAVTHDDRRSLRSDIYLVSESINKLNKTGSLNSEPGRSVMLAFKTHVDGITKFIPRWVKVAVAFALGLGTMIGWKRIVITVGEKIGKEHLTYAQGASAELVAMATIGAADFFGLPVSTTHVLSSGIAGTMAANHSGLQTGTLRNLALAWILTLPVCVFLGAALFALGINIVFSLGLR